MERHFKVILEPSLLQDEQTQLSACLCRKGIPDLLVLGAMELDAVLEVQSGVERKNNL